MDFSDSILDLERVGLFPEVTPNLTRIKEALTLLNLSNNSKKTIVVAGTNGKGSTCAVLECLLRHTKSRTGFFSSPHLVSYAERIKIDGRPISEKLFAKSYEAVAAKIKSLRLTHFEILTLMALWVFCSGEETPIVDHLILEVGLGGVFDATNAIPHKVSVITKIDYDHQNLLGATLTEIAKNKLGIVEPDSLVVHQPFPEETSTLVEKTKNDRGGHWFETPHYSFRGENGHPPKYFLKTPWGEAALSLAGGRGAENASLALTIFEKLGYDPSKHLNALGEVVWPGRMELVETSVRGTPTYVSGDHNPQGIDSLISLLEFYPREHLYLIVGIGKDKDREKILKPLFKLKNTSVFLTETPFHRTKLNEYGRFLDLAAGAFENPRDALTKAQSVAGEKDMILVTGSLYLVGEVKKFQ